MSDAEPITCDREGCPTETDRYVTDGDRTYCLVCWDKLEEDRREEHRARIEQLIEEDRGLLDALADDGGDA